MVINHLLTGMILQVGSMGYFTYTPQNKHGSPENGGPLEKEIPIGNHHFQVPC